MIHKLKTWPVFFEPVWLGEKTFELRKNDRGFKVGDTLLLQEYSLSEEKYLSREISATVTYIINVFDKLPKDLCIMSIRVDKKLRDGIEPVVRELDTQVIENREPEPGEYTCIKSFTNRLGYVYMTDSKLVVKRYNRLYETVNCELPDDALTFDMNVDILLEHFVKSDMIKP